MTNETGTTARVPIKFERRYDASVEDVWEALDHKGWF